MALVCQRVISQLRNSLRNGALAAKSGSFYALGFRSCKMRVTVLRNGTRVPKVGFAAAKYPAKWSFGCEIGIFHVLGLRIRFAATKPFLAHECHFATQFPSFRSCDTAAKYPLSCEITFKLRNGLREFPSFAKSTPRCESAPSFKNSLRKCHFAAK